MFASSEMTLRWMRRVSSYASSPMISRSRFFLRSSAFFFSRSFSDALRLREEEDGDEEGDESVRLDRILPLGRRGEVKAPCPLSLDDEDDEVLRRGEIELTEGCSPATSPEADDERPDALRRGDSDASVPLDLRRGELSPPPPPTDD